jgi:hypothetical protein
VVHVLGIAAVAVLGTTVLMLTLSDAVFGLLGGRGEPLAHAVAKPRTQDRDRTHPMNSLVLKPRVLLRWRYSRGSPFLLRWAFTKSALGAKLQILHPAVRDTN